MPWIYVKRWRKKTTTTGSGSVTSWRTEEADCKEVHGNHTARAADQTPWPIHLTQANFTTYKLYFNKAILKKYFPQRKPQAWKTSLVNSIKYLGGKITPVCHKVFKQPEIRVRWCEPTIPSCSPERNKVHILATVLHSITCKSPNARINPVSLSGWE
jgi:hypothetical protein